MQANKHLRFGYVDVEVNERGWRDRSYPQKAAPGTYRLMVVGDSVTFGYGVELSKTYHKQLEDRLNAAGANTGKRFEVIALAGGGGTTYDALRMVQRHFSYFDPKELWLAFNLNDILFNPYEPTAQPTGKDKRAVSPPSARVRAAMVLGWLREKADVLLRSRSHLYHLLRQRGKVLLRYFGIYSPTMQPEAAFAFSSEQAQAAWSATLNAVLEVREEVVRRGARFGVIVLPADPQTSPSATALYREKFLFRFDEDFAIGGVQERICQRIRTQGIECLDPLPLFRSYPDRQLFLRVHGDSVDWNHPNAAGHELLADALFAAIQPRLLTGAFEYVRN
jgi:lysophospholipase L1-like esterase